MAQIELSSLVNLTQSYIAKNYATALIDKSKTAELKAYIGKYLYDTGYSVSGYDTKSLVERLFTEMAEYSILTKHLADPDLEEININGWDDVALTHLDGRIEKAEEHFFSPQHAIDVVKKLLQHSGMIIDNAAPIAQGHLPNNTRITALKEPIVDADRGIAVSIRILQIFIGLFAAVGIGCILADLLKVPTMKASKAANNLGKKGDKKTSIIEIYLKEFATKLSEKIKLNEYKKAQLEADLRTAGMDITPELYVSNAIVKAVAIGLLAIPAFLIVKILGLFIVFVAIVVYFTESKKVTKMIAAKRKKIEYELPRLVGSIEKTMKHQKGAVYALEAFKDTTCPELKEELEITIADMRSGNEEVALTRLESRVGSTMMSDVTRGLIGVVRGDDMEVYWSTTAMKFADYQREQLKSQANAVPRKVRKLSMALLFCFILIYVAVLGQVLLTSMGTLF